MRSTCSLCLILFHSGLYKNVFVFPEVHTTDGGRTQSEERSVEDSARDSPLI